MQRYFLELSYNGTAYHGWQVQENAKSVQAVLNEAISKRCRKKIEVTGAGRTDTGVHALQMFCHFDLDKNIEDEKTFIYRLNTILPQDIVAYKLYCVPSGSHARFDAKSRSYIYQMHHSKDPFKENRSWYYPFELDIDKMNAACGILKNYHDFSCFSKSRTQTKTNLCKISKAQWIQKGNELQFSITADRFLRNMVRAIVGTMIEIGRDQITLQDFEEIIQSKDRRKAGISVPAHGLYLLSVKYPNKLLNIK